MTDVMSGQQERNTESERELKVAMAGPVPLMPEAPSTSIDLPRGLYHNGAWQNTVIVRELTGIDEEVLAKVPDQTDFFSTVIALGVESIGELALSSLPLAERKHHLSGLLLGERDMLFVKVSQVAFGNEKDVRFNCTLCNEPQTATLLLSEDFQPKMPDEAVLSKQYTTSTGDVIDYRAAVGSDQDEALAKKGASAAEQNTIVLSRCITKVNGQMVVDQLGFARKLSMRDRSTLLQAMIEMQPQIDLNLQTVCAVCGGDQTLGLAWGDIFRP